MKKGLAARAAKMCTAGGIIAFVAGVLAVSIGLQFAWFGQYAPPSETDKVIEIITRPLNGYDLLLLIPGIAGMVSGLMGIAGGIVCRKNKNAAAVLIIAAAALSVLDFFIIISIASIVLFIIAVRDLRRGAENDGYNGAQGLDEY